MPGYDGTGPLGRGPMTGRSRGYCLLKLSDKSGEPVKGYAGKTGLPVNKKLTNKNYKKVKK